MTEPCRCSSTVLKASRQEWRACKSSNNASRSALGATYTAHCIVVAVTNDKILEHTVNSNAYRTVKFSCNTSIIRPAPSASSASKRKQVRVGIRGQIVREIANEVIACVSYVYNQCGWGRRIDSDSSGAVKQRAVTTRHSRNTRTRVCSIPRSGINATYDMIARIHNKCITRRQCNSGRATK